MDELIKALQMAIERELMTEELGDLEPGIYIAVSSRIKEMREICENGVESVRKKIIERNIELLSSLVRDLLIIRVMKFFSNSLNGRNETKLTAQEKYIVDPILDSIKRLRRVDDALQFGFSHYIENLPRRQRYVLVRFLKFVDKFVGSDLKNYGPFEKDDLSLIPADNAKVLIDKNIAESIDVV